MNLLSGWSLYKSQKVLWNPVKSGKFDYFFAMKCMKLEKKFFFFKMNHCPCHYFTLKSFTCS